MEPSSGLSSTSTRVFIRGEGFLALPSEQQSGGGAVLDARHRAWLDDTELDAVTWIDPHTLEAIVPAGLPSGPKRLLVENAFGQRGALEAAFMVDKAGTQTPAALSATLAVQGNPTTVMVGQPLDVTLTVRDTGQGSASVTTVTPTSSPAGAATCGLPSPAPPQAIPGLGSTTFTWTCTATAAGSLTLGASVAGIATTGGAALQATAPGVALTVQLPAELTATIAASRSTANVGQAVTATLTLTNGGTSTANVTSITRSTTGTAAATCTSPSPASASIPTGGTRTFTWSCTPSTAGTLILSATATGTGGLSATPATPATVLVQPPAALTASLVALPTSVVVGQAVALTLTVQNTGGASGVVSSVVPLASGTAAASCGAVSPATPQTIAGGTSATFTWSCTPSSQGTAVLDATVNASDANTGTASSPAVAPVNVAVLTPAALTATVAADRSTANIGQPVKVTFTLTNGGAVTANITAISPVLSGGTAAGTTTCGTPTPPPTPLAPGGIGTFTWTCTSTGPGTLSLSGSAAGKDAVLGTDLSATPATPASVTIQTAALLAPAALQASRTTANVGQEVTVTLSLENQGEASAILTEAALTASGTGAATCIGPSPALPRTIVGLTSLGLTWTCTGSLPGTVSSGIVTFSATVTASDANTGDTISAAITPIDVVIQTPAALTATLTSDVASAQVNTPVTLTLDVHNSGGATARVETIIPDIAPQGRGGSCPDVITPPPPPVNVLGGATATFTWSCTSTDSRNFNLDATVTAADANTDANLSPSVATVPVEFTP